MNTQPTGGPSEREKILGAVRAALAPLPERASYPVYDTAIAVARVLKPQPTTWDLFAHRLQQVNGTPLKGLETLNDWLAAQPSLAVGYCDPALWPQLEKALPALRDRHVETVFDRARTDDYQFGITAATGAIAESGTVILSDAGTSSRLAALAPWVHIALLQPNTLYPDIPTALTYLPPGDPNIIWATGPSKTADVEGILIEGVHGPGIQVVVLVES